MWHVSCAMSHVSCACDSVISVVPWPEIGSVKTTASLVLFLWPEHYWLYWPMTILNTLLTILTILYLYGDEMRDVWWNIAWVGSPRDFLRAQAIFSEFISWLYLWVIKKSAPSQNLKLFKYSALSANLVLCVYYVDYTDYTNVYTYDTTTYTTHTTTLDSGHKLSIVSTEGHQGQGEDGAASLGWPDYRSSTPTQYIRIWGFCPAYSAADDDDDDDDDDDTPSPYVGWHISQASCLNKETRLTLILLSLVGL